MRTRHTGASSSPVVQSTTVEDREYIEELCTLLFRICVSDIVREDTYVTLTHRFANIGRKSLANLPPVAPRGM